MCFRDNSHFINHLRHSCPFLCKIQARSLAPTLEHSIRYRPDVDGLRAIAGLTVVVYHAWPKWLTGGFVGVDIFFVISGFLISCIILKQLREQTFSIADFYVRRVRRIFPALLLAMTSTIVFGWYVLLPNEFIQLGKHTMCPRTVAAAYRLGSIPDVKKVVIGAAWYGYFSPGQQELIYDDGSVRAQFPSKRAQDLTFMALEQSIAQLRTRGKEVYLVLQPPAGAEFDPRSMFTGSRLGEIRPRLNIKPFDIVAFNTKIKAQRGRLVEIAVRTGVHIIDPSNSMCSALNCSVIAADGTPLYTDSVHMRPAYTRRVGHFLDPTITVLSNTSLPRSR